MPDELVDRTQRVIRNLVGKPVEELPLDDSEIDAMRWDDPRLSELPVSVRLDRMERLMTQFEGRTRTSKAT
jgi:hypothetical protein